MNQNPFQWLRRGHLKLMMSLPMCAQPQISHWNYTSMLETFYSCSNENWDVFNLSLFLKGWNLVFNLSPHPLFYISAHSKVILTQMQLTNQVTLPRHSEQLLHRCSKPNSISGLVQMINSVWARPWLCWPVWWGSPLCAVDSDSGRNHQHSETRVFARERLEIWLSLLLIELAPRGQKLRISFLHRSQYAACWFYPTHMCENDRS